MIEKNKINLRHQKQAMKFEEQSDYTCNHEVGMGKRKRLSIYSFAVISRSDEHSGAQQRRLTTATSSDLFFTSFFFNGPVDPLRVVWAGGSGQV